MVPRHYSREINSLGENSAHECNRLTFSQQICQTGDEQNSEPCRYNILSMVLDFLLNLAFNCIHYKVLQGFVKYKVGEKTAFQFSAKERNYILV